MLVTCLCVWGCSGTQACLGWEQHITWLSLPDMNCVQIRTSYFNLAIRFLLHILYVYIMPKVQLLCRNWCKLISDCIHNIVTWKVQLVFFFFSEHDKENDIRNAQATQAVIQRRRRPKRRSTGVVHVDMDVRVIFLMLHL